MAITPSSIALKGDDAGVFYALEALAQLVALGMARGPTQGAEIPCGIIEDAPAFSWRGMMMDSARHFQSVERLRRLLDTLAQWRINRFHWHLTESNSFRLCALDFPKAGETHEREPGQYSIKDVKEILAYAKERFITVIPEVDMPGHANAILRAYPGYACDPKHPGHEFCIGSDAVRKRLKAFIGKVVRLFPDSPWIHLGGDEAETKHWEQCPKCQAALTKHKCKTMRGLENNFMREMAQEVIRLGRTPMLWYEGGKYPKQVMLQMWRRHGEVPFPIKEKNPVVNSVNSDFYLDYRQDLREPFMPFHRMLTEEEVYRADPECGYGKKVRAILHGVECCLWTQFVPSWRIDAKLFPRLYAFSEVAWNHTRRTCYDDYVLRRQFLAAVGYL